jgi:hypothetical protein
VNAAGVEQRRGGLANPTMPLLDVGSEARQLTINHRVRSRLRCAAEAMLGMRAETEECPIGIVPCKAGAPPLALIVRLGERADPIRLALHLDHLADRNPLELLVQAGRLVLPQALLLREAVVTDVRHNQTSSWWPCPLSIICAGPLAGSWAGSACSGSTQRGRRSSGDPCPEHDASGRRVTKATGHRETSSQGDRESWPRTPQAASHS